MDLIVKIKDKKMYDSFVRFFKSLGLQVETAKETKKKSIKKEVEFKALKLKTKGKSFNRDEANER